MSTDPSSRTDFGPFLANVGPSYVDQNNQVQSIRFGNVEDLERALELHGEHVAAFLVEPIQGEAGWVVFFLIFWFFFVDERWELGRKEGGGARASLSTHPECALPP
jgi:hypothetical protein